MGDFPPGVLCDRAIACSQQRRGVVPDPESYSPGMRESRGHYNYLPGLVFASLAVVAQPGVVIERACFPACLPLAEGFDAVRAALERFDRPLAALCGFDLRLPAARRLEDFVAFNGQYLEQLRSWELLDGDDSPLARTNVAPVRGGVSEPGVLGFSYTVEGDSPSPTFVVSGVPEVGDDASGPDDVVRLGETTPDALEEKLEFVIRALKERLAELGVEWDDDALVQLYTAHDAASALNDILVREGINPVFGLTWHEAAPPVDLLELEIDVRRYARETVVGH